MIRLENISQHYPCPNGEVFHALDKVSLNIAEGEIFGIIGRSGAGKSTLVRCINFLNRPTEGRVWVAGKCLNTMSDEELRETRRRIGMIFQHFNILSSRTVFENVAFPLELAGVSREKIQAKVDPLLELVGLTEHRDKYPNQLSGGQKQRVGIARALANDPQVLLSDEATSALDPETTVATLELLKRINRELGLTIVLITHQMEVVKQICDKVAVMNLGQVVECGPVIEVFRSPRHETTRSLISTVIGQGIPQSMQDTLRYAVKSQTRENPAHVLRLTFIGSEVTHPVISQASRKFDVDFSILLGQIDEIQSMSFGSLTVMVNCSRSKLLDIEDFLCQHNVTVEEITNGIV